MAGGALVVDDLCDCRPHAHARIGGLSRRRHLLPDRVALGLDLGQLRRPRLELRSNLGFVRGGLLASLLKLIRGFAKRLVRSVRVLHELHLRILLLGEALFHVLHLVGHLQQLGGVADAPTHQLLLASAQPRAMRLSLVVRLANPGGRRRLHHMSLGERFLALDDLRIRFEARVGALDVVAQPALPLDQALVLKQELGRLGHSSTTSTWPSLTTSVSLTRISFTVPARGAVTGISIFIDSRMSSVSSSATWSPGLAVIFQTLPTSSALTSVILRAALSPTLSREAGEGELLPGLGDAGDFAAQVVRQAACFFDQVPVALRHLSLLLVEVVLQTHTYVAAYRDRRRHQRPLVEADADHLPVRALRQRIDLVDQVARRAGDAAKHTHDEAELVGRVEHAHIDERAGVADVSRVEAFHLWANPRG